MRPEFRSAIENDYGIRLQSCTAVAGGAVAAESWALRDEKGGAIFCKIVDRPDFISIILPTLPVLREMKDKGIARIAAPLPARDGFSARCGGALIMLFDYFPAKQGYNYDLPTFGKLLGDIHGLTPRLSARLPLRGFSTFREGFFKAELPALVARKTDDPVLLALQDVLRRNATETQACVDAFFRLAQRCGENPATFVNTHGDVHGNVLVASPQDICLVDWDEMELAPPERDLWLLSKEPDFMKGYRSARPGFTPDPDALKHATLKNYLEGIPIYLTPILDEGNSVEARLAHIQKLEAKRFNGWLKPLVQEILRAEA